MKPSSRRWVSLNERDHNNMFSFRSFLSMMAVMPARPTFLLDIPLRDLENWWLRLRCCERTVDLPFRFLAAQTPGTRLGGLLERLRCRDCGKPLRRALIFDDPADNAGRRPEAAKGWRIEIVLPGEDAVLGQHGASSGGLVG